MTETIQSKLVVLGGGPGGYAAAFYAADLGLEVTLVEREENPGGVCLYRGCIPSKALLHVAEVMAEAKEASEFGVEFSQPSINLDKLRDFKSGVVSKLTGGLGQLAKARKVNFVRGEASLVDGKSLLVKRESGDVTVQFENLILATGSRPTTLPGLDLNSERLWDSTSALDLPSIPKKLLVIGAGYIGLELGSVYASLGSSVSVVEMTDGVIPGADRDMAKVLHKSLDKLVDEFLFETKVTGIVEEKKGLRVTFETKDGSTKDELYDNVLVSIGRRPNTENLGLDKAGVQLTERGFIQIQPNCQTTAPGIYAIGDVAGDPMLAHKAAAEGKVAVEAVMGKRVAFEPKAIPAVIFTNPEVAWCGLTETEAKKQGVKVSVAKFPWAASGRAMTLNRTEGLTKLIIDPETDMILGMGIVGPGAGDMISEGVVAIEMCATAADLELCIHPHPTLSETIMQAAELYYGHATDMYRPKRKK